MGTEDSKILARSIGVSFGGLVALQDVNLTIHRREIFGLIGPNGAGKTTLVNVLSGFQKPTTGEIVLDGQTLSGSGPIGTARAGVSRTFQAARLFPSLCVLENLCVPLLASGISRQKANERGMEMLGHFKLAHLADREASTLNYSDARRVGIARALVTRPRFALLDEPASGMNEQEGEALMRLIVDIPGQFGCGILLIEHNMQVVMGVCSRVHVLDSGRTIAEGTPGQVTSDPAVIEAYLGKKKLKDGASLN